MVVMMVVRPVSTSRNIRLTFLISSNEILEGITYVSFVYNVDLFLPALKLRILKDNHFKANLQGHQGNFMLKNSQIED